jgi:hypothetical protein
MFVRPKKRKYFKIAYIDSVGKQNVKYYERYSQKEAERRLETLSSFDRILSSEEITKDEFLKYKTTKPYKSSKLWEVKFRDKDGIIQTKEFRSNYKSTCETNAQRVRGFRKLISIKEITQ